MHSSVAADQPQIRGRPAVDERVLRAIAYAEHIAVFADGRPDVALTKFYENFGIERAERLCNLTQQQIHSGVQRLDVPAGIDGRRVGKELKGIDKIQLQAVQPPASHGVRIQVGQIGPDFRKARIQNPHGPVSVLVAQTKEHIRKARKSRGVFPDKWDRIPQQELHSEPMHRIDKRFHIRNFARRNPPVPAIGIPA